MNTAAINIRQHILDVAVLYLLFHKLTLHSVCVQDCSHIDEHGIAAALLPLVTAFCRVSITKKKNH